MNADVSALTFRLAEALLARDKRIVTAESCTGGLIAKTCTDLAGSSDWFDRGFVTYSNTAKSDMLAVPPALIDEYGAVSEPVALAMAAGALRASGADYAVAVTGIAGPAGGSADKPVGTVWIAVARDAEQSAREHRFDGDRAAVRDASLLAALEALLALIEAD